MPTVANIKLQAGKSDDGRKYARVVYDLQFTAAEVAENLVYPEVARLYEIDEKKDRYSANHASPGDIVVGVDAGDNPDDLIAVFRNGTIQPNGAAAHAREWETSWTAGNESGREEYEALIHIAPPLPSVFSWSNRVTIDLD